MNRLTIADLPLAGLKRINRQRIGDERGFFSRLFCADELAAAGWNHPIVQINHTYTAKRGTVRGLHFQYPPHAEMKYVCCLRGEVWDVAVDVRAGSETFLQWHAETLTSDNGVAIVIPEGFAHGFQTLTDDVELLYCHSAAYAKDAESGLNVRDPRLSIAWPLQMTELSSRDADFAFANKEFEGVAH
jgi:dTDP-4-dehydrorhamnose 3,5-epimerase